MRRSLGSRWGIALVSLMATYGFARPAFAVGEIDDPGLTASGAPGTSAASFQASYLRFTSFFDADGRHRSLDGAYGGTLGPARGVAVDTLVLSFEGRYVFASGLSAGVNVPLVRDSRSGTTSIAPGIDQSVYAEGSAVGDIVGDVMLARPFKEVPGMFGADLALQGPTGQSRDIASDQLPTGGGALGVGGEIFATLAGDPIDTGAAAGLLIQLPRHTGGHDVDAGDPLWLRGWAAARLSRGTRVGLAVCALARTADRVDGTAVSQLSFGGTPGAASPASNLLTVEPYVEVRAGHDSWMRLSISNPGAGWLFAPVDTGFALRGKNILAPEAQARLGVVARF